MQSIKGQRFGRLVVLDFVEKTKKGNTWRCLCDCGKEIVTREYSLKSGHTKSCGCRRKEFAIKHGGHKDPFYSSWQGMMGRCYNQKNASYKAYGKRGIKVCDEWHNFNEFKKWVLSDGTFKNGLSIDRIDVNGDYCPENCKWSTPKEQARNKRNVVLYKGECLATWAERVGLPYWLVYNRHHALGWTIEQALNLTRRTVNKRPKITLDGKPLSEWVKKQNLPYQLVYNRIHRDGWTVEEALELIPHERKHKRKRDV